MLQPKKRKYRKCFKGKNKGKAYRGNEVVFGDYGLKALEQGLLSDRELEAARKKITFATKKMGKYWFRVFPHRPVTKKPVGVKMGGGKGEIDHYVAQIKSGSILFEISGVPLETAQEAFRKAGHKLSIKTTLVNKE